MSKEMTTDLYGYSEQDLERAKEHYEKFLEALGVGVHGEHLEDTPERVVKSRLEELFRGIHEAPRDHLKTTFEDMGQYNGDAGWVVVDGISVKSMCSHHMLPFRGQAHVGYVPREQAVGLSKLSRVVDGYARRPQVQERLTNQIANAIHQELDPLAVAVVIEAEHECMCLRGVEEPGSMTRTSALRGLVREDNHMRKEFFDLVGGVNGQ